MISDDSLKQVERFAKNNPAVQEMLDEYMSFFEDPAKNYYNALVDASKELTALVKSKEIDIDSPYEKAVIRLLEGGDKVYKTLRIGQSSSGVEEEKPEDIKGQLENLSNNKKKP